jgi:hypothetical protein
MRIERLIRESRARDEKNPVVFFATTRAVFCMVHEPGGDYTPIRRNEALSMNLKELAEARCSRCNRRIINTFQVD